MVGAMPVCSPLGLDEYKKTRSCFSPSALTELATSWNKLHPEAPIDTSGKPADIRKRLGISLKTQCGNGTGTESCWVQKLGGMSANKEAAKLIMPLKPKEWGKEPRKWLNNYDIDHIMTRFEGDEQFPFKFLGVFPIDFQGKDSVGNVLYPAMHQFNLSNFLVKNPGTKFIGIITNLDTHEGSGTHWTSSFICVDPSLPCFGAYYYDSTFTKSTNIKRVPPEIRTFFKSLKAQAEMLPNFNINNKFKNVFYKLSHQRGNTECGMFSIFYQVHWLRSLIKDIHTTHKDIIRLKITDDQVFRLRDFFFPNAS